MATISGLLLFISHSMNFIAGPTGTVVGKIGVFFAHLLLVFTFIGLYLKQGERNGITGFLGMLFGVIGTVIVTAIVFVEIAGATGVVIGDIFLANGVNVLYNFGPLLFVLGVILMSISIINGKMIHSMAGYFLLLGTFIFVSASFFVYVQALFQVIGAFFTGAGFIYSAMKTKNYEIVT